MTTYDVRIWSIREFKGRDRKTGKPKSTYRLRWKVAGREFGDSFQTRACSLPPEPITKTFITTYHNMKGKWCQ